MRSDCRRCLAMDVRFDLYNQAFRRQATVCSCSSPNSVRIIKSRRMRLITSRYVARTGDMELVQDGGERLAVLKAILNVQIS
jgi:hypothetical protein